MSSAEPYKLVRLANGSHSVRSTADAETFHPGIGPEAEAEALYVRQLRLPERVAESTDDFVVWDVGLGAGGNALSAIRLIAESLPNSAAPRGPNRALQILSFDQTLEAFRFALQHPSELRYVGGFETAGADLIRNQSAHFQFGGVHVNWTVRLGDFPENISAPTSAHLPAPHAILFDPHSPRKNPSMWTVSLFENLFRCLAPERPCALANFTRSTLARVAMLLGGWFVGAGHPSGMKEETTVAANRLELIDQPLDQRWLERARRSDSAEPLWTAEYRQAPLSEETWARLLQHPQFRAKAESAS